MKKANILSNAMILVGICFLLWAVYELTAHTLQYRRENYQNQRIREEYVTEVFEDTQDTDADLSVKKSLSIDWSGLKKENRDVVGWLWIPSLEVSYPILYSGDNEKYLYHNLMGKYSSSGSIFLSETNAPDMSDPVSLVYGHNMRDGSMFGSLKKYQEESFGRKNPDIMIYTPKEKLYYQIYSCSMLSEANMIYQQSLQKDVFSEESRKEFLRQIDKTGYWTNHFVPVSKQMLVLSTCSTEGNRLVVVAFLIKSKKA